MNVQLEDVFKLGQHRVICGDALIQSHYDALLHDNKIDLVLTDPPYGVNYAEKNKHLNKIGKGNRIENNIINDNITDYMKFFTDVTKNWKPYFQEYNSIYIYV